MIVKHIKLPDLVVKSFVTQLSVEDQKTIQGGNVGTTEVPIYC